MRYILRDIAVCGALLLGLLSCNVDDPMEGNIAPGSNLAGGYSAQLAPSCVVESLNVTRAKEAGISVRSLVDQITTKQLNSNFLRMDEDVDDSDDGLYTFKGTDQQSPFETNWNKAQLLEATIISSPDNTTGIHYRSVSLAPEQTYKLKIVREEKNGETIVDTTHFYHTRMVGWYPMNCKLPRRDGVPAATTFDYAGFDAVRIQETIPINGTQTNVVALQFTGLDGETDLMVSNLREGQSWHQYNPLYPHESDKHPQDDSNIYRHPFGHNVSAPVYSNFITYRHYRSAIRITAFAEDSDQNLNMWGRITNVIIRNQPTACKIWLPTQLDQFGEVYEWSNESDHPIVKASMFDNDSNHPEFAEEAKYPVSMEGSSLEEDVYLGYSLIQPHRQVELEIHTDAGVYSTVIEPTFTTSKGEKVNLFQAGYIYDVKLSLSTNGSIGTILTQDGAERYYDLSILDEVEDNSDHTLVSTYRLSNCYILDPTKYVDDNGNSLYDGYSFLATIVGNGEAGIISSGAQTLYPTTEKIEPVSAHLLWESQLGLVSDIELKFGYVRFKLPDNTKRGNAVIAVYDSNDKVLWSWHIWITTTPKTQTFSVSGSGDSHTITFLDRNLGATAATCTNANDALATYGLYYQWGRKDPSMGPPTYNYAPINLNTAPYYDFSSDQKTAAEVTQFAQPTLRNAVENPMFLILPTSQTLSYTFNWLHDRYDFLWGYDNITGMTRKTIYDPCPYGYRVPSSELRALFSLGEGSVGTYGYTRKVNNENFFFPYTGFKGVDIGLNSMVASWKYVGAKADYQSSMYCTDADAVNNGGINQYMHRSRIYLSSKDAWTEVNVAEYAGNVHYDFANRRTAAPVRCVKDEKIGSITATLTPSVASYSSGGISITLDYKAHSYGSSISSITIKSSLDSNINIYHMENINEYVWNDSGISYDIPRNTTGNIVFYIIIENDHGLIYTEEVTLVHKTS